MSSRRASLAVLFAALAVLTAACGSEAKDGIETVQTAPSATRATACQMELDTLHTAVEAYTILEERAPERVEDLVGSVLKKQPTFYLLKADGSIGLTKTGRASGCASVLAADDRPAP